MTPFFRRVFACNPGSLFCLLVAMVLLSGLLGGAPVLAESVKIAAVYSVTGLAAPANAPPLAGARMAVQEINANGGVMGRELELLVFDNQSTPIGSSLAVKKAEKAGVAAIMGLSWSSHALAGAKEAQKLRIPMCVDMATHPAVTRIGDCIFRTCFTDVFQGRVLAYFAWHDLGLRSLVSLVDVNSDYSLGLDVMFKEPFILLGGSVSQRVTYKDNALSREAGLNQLLDTLTALRVEGLFIPGHRDSQAIVRALRQHGITAPALGGDGWDQAKHTDLASYEGQGIYYCAHWSRQWDTPANRTFVEHYSGSMELSSTVALAYDTIHVLAAALERTGDTDREAVRKALAQTRRFPGVTGNITFDAEGDPVKKAVIMQVVDGEPVALKTVEPSEVSP